MRLFKYLVFIFFISSASSAFANFLYTARSGGVTVSDTFPTAYPSGEFLTSLCTSLASRANQSGRIGWTNNNSDGQCTVNGSGFGNWVRSNAPAPECLYPHERTYFIPSKGVFPKVSCEPLQGTSKFCVYKAPDKPIYITVPGQSGKETTVGLFSVSKNPVSDCTAINEQGCDMTNPYGGCFAPADDGCTRQHDGSIVCPEEKQPVIDQGCNGADYCKRPPQGCGVGYVSGNYNGERVCIRSSKPADGNTPVDPNNPDPVDPNKSVTDSVKDLKDTFEHYLKETVQSIDALSKNPLSDSPVNVTANVEVDIDLSETNAKIDETNGILDEIKEWLFEDVNESDLEADMPSDIELSKRSFSQTIFGSQTSCPSDRTLSMTLFTGKAFSYDFSFRMFCEKLEILGYLILIFAYYQAVMIVVRSA